MATLRQERKQAPAPSEYAIVPGDRDTEYMEVGDAYPLATKTVSDTTGNLSSSEQFLGQILSELVKANAFLAQLTDSTLSP